jgi:uncharacterized protein YcfJ
MTDLKKKVTRRDDVSLVRDRGKLRRVIVTLYPGGTIGFRLEKTRKEEIITVAGAYHQAVKARVMKEQAEKRTAKAAKKKAATERRRTK